MSALDLSLGCIYIGVMLNIWLYGFTCVQTYIYFVRFKSDRQLMKIFVTFLFAADTINSVLDAVFLYKYLVTNYGNVAYAMRSNDEFATDPLCVSIIGFATQLFFAWRVWRLLPGRWSWVPPMIIFLLGFLSFLGALGTTIGVVIVRTFSEFQKFQQAVIVWLACTAAADVVVTVSLITTLHRARTGFTKTDDIITKLIRSTLQTGLLTSSFAVIDLILFLCSTTTLHLVFNLPLSKLYVNSLLSTLNARSTLFQTRPGCVEGVSGSQPMTNGTITDTSNLKSMEAGVSFTTGTDSAIESRKYMSRDFSPSTTTLSAGDLEKEGATPTVNAETNRSNRSSNARISLDSKRISGFLQPWSAGQVQSKSANDDAYLLTKRPSSKKGRTGTDGVEIVTVEEQFESKLPQSDAELVPDTMTFYSQANQSHSDVASNALHDLHTNHLGVDIDEQDSPTSSTTFRHPYSQS